MAELSAGIRVQDWMARLRKILVAVFVWARRSCVQPAKREDSRKIPLGRRTKVSTHLEAEKFKLRNRRWIDGPRPDSANQPDFLHRQLFEIRKLQCRGAGG